MTNIIVRTQFAATHCWPACNIPEVIYLRNKHRHMFHIVAKKSVLSLDREIEFIALKMKVDSYLAEYKGELGTKSCEQLAEELIGRFSLNYCEVSEDGENGAEVYL